MTPPASPRRPTLIYLNDYGYHSSLLLPVGDGRWVEYLYGDWDWAAADQTGVWPAARAAVWSSGATLGRRYTRVLPPGTAPQPPSVPQHQEPLWVDGDRVRSLVAELGARWQAHADTAVAPAAGAGYVFVRDDQSYGLLHNCNRVTADELDALGCTTGGLPILSHFRIGRPAAR